MSNNNADNISKDRRSFLNTSGVTVGGALLASVLPIRAAAAPEVTNVKITQAITALAFIQNYVAQELGYFKDEGLNVELIDTRGGGPDVQAVLAGDAQFTVNDGAQVLPALAKGQDLKCYLALLDRNIINVSMNADSARRLGISAESPFESKLASLKGLKIGVTRPGALTWQLARFNLAKAGLNPDVDAEVIGLGGGPALSAALEKGIVDVIYIAVPFGERVVALDKGISFIDNSSGEDVALPKFMMEGLWARPDFVKQNPNTTIAVARALKRASDFIASQPIEETVASLMPVFGGLGESLLIDGVTKVRGSVSHSGSFDQQTLDYTQDVLTLNDVIKERFEIGKIFDPAFLGKLV